MVLDIFFKLASNYHTNKFYFFHNKKLILNANTVIGYQNVKDFVMGYVKNMWLTEIKKISLLL